jgi:4-aminobutyrate aminotransferase-like enzyme
MSSYRPAGAARSHDPLSGLTWVRGSGPHLWDSTGRRYLDFIGGYSSCVLGHGHPRLVAAAGAQLERLAFAHAADSLERQELEARMVESFAPTDALWKVWMTSGGARAVELAWKIATAHRSGGILRFDRAYHGRSLATARISDTARSGALALPDDLDLSIPFPVMHAGCRESHESRCRLALEKAEEILASHHHRLSMLLMEPALGSRGYYFAPPWFGQRLAALAHRYGLLVVSDEIQMGLGRMGAWSVARCDGWDPDLIVLGKSLGGGIVSMGAVLGPALLLDAVPEGIESETYAAMPFACRIGREVIDVLDQEGWVHTSQERGRLWRGKLRAVLPEAIAICGRGLATALDFSNCGDSPTEVATKWVVDLARFGLLVHLTGPARDRLALIPPLNLSEEWMDEALEIILRKVLSC